MTTKPCACSEGHRYFPEEADANQNVCPVDGQPIVCPTTTDVHTSLAMMQAVAPTVIEHLARHARNLRLGKKQKTKKGAKGKKAKSRKK